MWSILVINDLAGGGLDQFSWATQVLTRSKVGA